MARRHRRKPGLAKTICQGCILTFMNLFTILLFLFMALQQQPQDFSPRKNRQNLKCPISEQSAMEDYTKLLQLYVKEAKEVTDPFFPIQTKMVNLSRLSNPEIDYINGYQAKVWEKVSPFVEGSTQKWLWHNTRPLPRSAKNQELK